MRTMLDHTFRRSLAALLAATALSTFGCSSKEGGGGNAQDGQCREFVVPADADLKTPVGFAAQVLPIFQQHCSYGECHGKTEKPVLGLLGEGAAPDDIKKNLVNVPSARLARMNYVTPGKPEESFLMRTMDGDQCVLNSECRNGNCGEPMPNDRPLLSVAERNIVRAWITQGAN